MDITSLEGETFGPYPMRVCLEKVTEFLDVVGGERARWTETAPPGYLATALFVVAPELLGKLHGLTVIHGEQTFRWLQPLVMERDLMVSGTVTRIRERAGSYFVSFEMAINEPGGEIASGTSLFLVSPASPASGSGGERPQSAPDDRGGPGPAQKSASRSDLVRYAAATRDWNPIHWDHDAARSAGLDGVVVHGLLQAAWALDEAAKSSSGKPPFSSARIRFRNPLNPATPVDVNVESGPEKMVVDISNGGTQYLTAQIEPTVG